MNEGKKMKNRPVRLNGYFRAVRIEVALKAALNVALKSALKTSSMPEGRLFSASSHAGSDRQHINFKFTYINR